jgi:hypothetical protein
MTPEVVDSLPCDFVPFELVSVIPRLYNVRVCAHIRCLERVGFSWVFRRPVRLGTRMNGEKNAAARVAARTAT